MGNEENGSSGSMESEIRRNREHEGFVEVTGK